MKKSLSALALAGIVMSMSASAQSPVEAAHKGIPGYLDPRTRQFTMLAAQEAGEATVGPNTSTVDVSSAVKVTGTITVASSSLTSNAKIGCDITLGLLVLDGGGVNEEYIEIGSGEATRSGNTATCVVSVPFDWKLIDPSKDSVDVSVNILGTDDTTGFTREETRPPITIAVPVSGTPTQVTFTSRF